MGCKFRPWSEIWRRAVWGIGMCLAVIAGCVAFAAFIFGFVYLIHNVPQLEYIFWWAIAVLLSLSALAWLHEWLCEDSDAS